MREVERRIAVIAERQHGVATRAQLLDTGMTRGAIDARVRADRLHAIHRGVYLLGGLAGRLAPPSAIEMAAVLACGPQARVSHRSAAALWELLPKPDSGPVDITLPTRLRRRRPGIRAHRSDLGPRDTTRREGIPLTTAARTLRDLSSLVSSIRLNRIAARAERAGLVSAEDLHTLVKQHQNRPGARLLRTALQADELTFTRSQAEERFLELVPQSGLACPSTNVTVAGHELDFLWRSASLAVEVDGYRYHRSRRSFESDRRKDAELAAAGIQVLRVTWRQIDEEPTATLVRLAQALVRSAPRSG